jgi:anti-sigma factor RsiW
MIRGSCEDDRLIDLLVDGELETSRRRELLERLDTQPDGWRRCAMAFLEDQSWGEALRSHSGATDAEREAAAPYPANGRASSAVALAFAPQTRPTQSRAAALGRTVSSVAALAAGLLLAFGLGWTTRGSSRPTTTPILSHRGSAATSAPPAAQTVAHGIEPSSQPSPAPATSERVMSVGGGMIPAGPTLSQRGLGIDPSWFQQPPTPLSQAFRDRVERGGYEIGQRRRLVSIRLDDGRRVSVPVEETRLRFIGNHTF